MIRLTRHNGFWLRLAIGCCLALTIDLPTRAADPSESSVNTHGLQLPTSFIGNLPCLDCGAIRYQLDLWPDQVFHLHRDWVGLDRVHDEVGRWRMDSARQRLILQGGAEMPLEFAISGAQHLVPLATAGQAPVASSAQTLVNTGQLTPINLRLLLGGELSMQADNAQFTECLTGRRYAVVAEGDFKRLQQVYAQTATEPNASLYVTFEGRMAPSSSGAEGSVSVQRFIHAWPDERCERARADASLTNNYWRINQLGGQPVKAAEGRREPHLLLRTGQPPRYVASVGCNQLTGDYRLQQQALTFSAAATARMACAPALELLEQQLTETLEQTSRWQIRGNTLELLDASGRSIGLFEAVYF